MSVTKHSYEEEGLVRASRNWKFGEAYDRKEDHILSDQAHEGIVFIFEQDT